MEMKIMLAGVLVLVGFLWAYLFVRQFVFNIRVANPVIRKMNSLQEDMISVGAKRYTAISNLASLLVGAVTLAIVVFLCRKSPYLLIAVAVGAVFAIAFIVVRTKPDNKDMFDLFSRAYARFIPDDELRTILYNKEYEKVKARLMHMGVQDTFLPDFKKKSAK